MLAGHMAPGLAAARVGAIARNALDISVPPVEGGPARPNALPRRRRAHLRRKPGAPRRFLAHVSGLGLAGLELRRFLRACARPARSSFRVNTLKAGPDVLEKLHLEGTTISPVPWCANSFFADATEEDTSTSVGQCRQHRTGEIYGQEPTSMLPVEVIAGLLSRSQQSVIEENSRPKLVLDLCAAPGSKTTQLCALIGDDGLVIANDPNSERVGVLRANVLRAAGTNCIVVSMDGRSLGPLAPSEFDVVLVDAPCSAEGNVRKDPSALDRWGAPNHDDQLQSVVKLQQELLTSGWEALRPGGYLVYATCTINTEENESQCQWFLDEIGRSAEPVQLNTILSLPEAAFQGACIRIWPHTFDTEAFFVGCFRKVPELMTAGDQRVGSSSNEVNTVAPWTLPELTQAQIEDLQGSVETQHGFWPLAGMRLVKDMDGTVRSLPPLIRGLERIAKYASSPGIRVGFIKPEEGYELHSELLLVSGDRASKKQPPPSCDEWSGMHAEAGGGLGALSLQMASTAEKGDAKGTGTVLKEMEAKRLSPDVVAYNTLLKAHERKGDALAARQVLLAMRQSLLSPNLVSFSTMISAYAKAGDPAGAATALADMRRSSITPNVFSFTSLISAHARAGDAKSAELVLEDLVSCRLNPELKCYSALLDAHARCGDVREAQRVFAAVQQEGLRPDVQMYTSLMKAQIKDGRMEEAEQILVDMRQARLKPDCFTYTALIDGHARAGDTLVAERILNDMVSNTVSPSLITYTCLMGAYAATKDTERAERLMADVIQQRLKPDKQFNRVARSAGVKPNTGYS